ncbi:hypothetical protein [Streptomyces sp. NBC_00102]|uniref:hypothetical protein n=1 Tax=Streptomyces sp. NBC_00102 TaxID=2975652 RepID=UPI00224EA95B|nr:hypothetical protein [Streptomyces sp. NBC_00102]MCX5400321.1 hypothetical protein [Streptomyces sp. NBC_00102]
MNSLLTTLGGKLAERWLNLLVLPGALFLAAAAAGTTLGHRHWHDTDRLRAALDDLAIRPALDRAGTAALLVALLLLAASAASLAAQFLGGAIERYWLRFGRDRVSRALTACRARRWRELDTRYEEAHGDLSAAGGGPWPPPDVQARIENLAGSRDRIALRAPTRPTWYGDRVQAARERVHAAYGVDLAAVWPRLWLTLPEQAVRQIQSAQDSFAAAARIGAWAAGYALLACWWWPAALVAVCCAAVARSRARDALELFAELIEAAVDVHGRELAERIGLNGAESAVLTDEVGERMSELFRKGG